MEEKLAILRDAVEKGKEDVTSDVVIQAMMQVVPTYHTPEEVNRSASEAEEIKLANSEAE